LARITIFENSLFEVLMVINKEIHHSASMADRVTRKDFALNTCQSAYSKYIVFSLWDELSSSNIADKIVSQTIAFILKNCNNNKNFNAMKETGRILQNLPDWHSPMFSEE
jgi:hypothetical protein